MTLSLDAREVLAYLNEMGYRNISAEQLKEFLIDLKKLIKYEERIGSIHRAEAAAKSTDNRFELLYKASTVSFRAKTKKKDCNVKPDEHCTKSKSPVRVRKMSKTRDRCPQTEVEPRGRATQPAIQTRKVRSASSEKKSTRMWIRPKSACSSTSLGRLNDPVQLYQFYKDEWRKFKRNLPGENDHSELRWSIRHKLLGT